MCCMQNKSNTKWLFTWGTLDVKVTNPHVIYVRGANLETNGGFSSDVHAAG